MSDEDAARKLVNAIRAMITAEMDACVSDDFFQEELEEKE